mgnify:CR=1 FL=1
MLIPLASTYKQGMQREHTLSFGHFGLNRGLTEGRTNAGGGDSSNT